VPSRSAQRARWLTCACSATGCSPPRPACTRSARSPTSGRCSWRLGPRRLISAGLPIVAAAMIAMTQVGPGTSLWLVRLIMVALGLGISLVFIPNQAASMATITKTQTGRASAIFNAGKQLGGAVGIALLSTVLAAAGPTREQNGHLAANLSAYHDGFLAAAAVALIAVLVARTVNDTDAAATMVRPQRPAVSSPQQPREAPVG
jgi:MFS family permease